MEREARRARALQKAAEGKGDGSHNAVFDDDLARHLTGNTTRGHWLISKKLSSKTTRSRRRGGASNQTKSGRRTKVC
jgi:hypothetical protein